MYDRKTFPLANSRSCLLLVLLACGIGMSLSKRRVVRFHRSLQHRETSGSERESETEKGTHGSVCALFNASAGCLVSFSHHSVLPDTPSVYPHGNILSRRAPGQRDRINPVGRSREEVKMDDGRWAKPVCCPPSTVHGQRFRPPASAKPILFRRGESPQAFWRAVPVSPDIPLPTGPINLGRGPIRYPPSPGTTTQFCHIFLERLRGQFQPFGQCKIGEEHSR